MKYRTMHLSLVDKHLVDLGGPELRSTEDIAQLHITKAELEAPDQPPKGFKDHGIVIYQNHEFYMTTMTRYDND